MERATSPLSGLVTERRAERSPLVCPAETRGPQLVAQYKVRTSVTGTTLLFLLGAPDHQPVGTVVGSSPAPGFPTALEAAIFLVYLPLSSPEA